MRAKQADTVRQHAQRQLALDVQDLPRGLRDGAEIAAVPGHRERGRQQKERLPDAAGSVDHGEALRGDPGVQEHLAHWDPHGQQFGGLDRDDRQRLRSCRAVWRCPLLLPGLLLVHVVARVERLRHKAPPLLRRARDRVLRPAAPPALLAAQRVSAAPRVPGGSDEAALHDVGVQAAVPHQPEKRARARPDLIVLAANRRQGDQGELGLERLERVAVGGAGRAAPTAGLLVPGCGVGGGAGAGSHSSINHAGAASAGNDQGSRSSAQW